uniref:Peptide ABC transporter substrate-binding protein n=1 Tax=candidate division CPR3 bacterium TaxID=2268181 RepID=A0A7C5UWA3_UNCC3
MVDVSTFVKKIRDFWWNYPSLLLKGIKFIVFVYYKTRPFSVMLVMSIIVGTPFLYLYSVRTELSKILAKSYINTFVEGVVSSPIYGVDPLPISSVPQPSTQLQRDLTSLIFDPLIRVKKDGSVENLLADNVTMLEDAKTVSINIKKDVKWQDGEKMTIEDVIFTFELIKRIGKSSIYYTSVNGVELVKVDDYTISLLLEKPNTSYIESLIWPVLPKHILENIGDPTKIKESFFGRNPVGTGRYILSSISESEIVLQKNPFYWGESLNIDKIIFRLYKTVEEAIVALKVGVVHAVCNYDLLQIDDPILEKMANFYTASLVKRTMVIYFNLRKGKESFIGNENVRKALAYAIPKSSILENVLHGFGDIVVGPIPSWSWAFYEDIEKYEYNLEKAKKLLDDAGYKLQEGEEFRKNGDRVAEIDLTFQDEPVRAAIAKAIAEAWKEIGVKVTLNPVSYYVKIEEERIENALYQTVIPPRDFTTLLFIQEAPLDPDRYSLYHSINIDYPGGNISGYKENKVDIDLEMGRSTMDKKVRKEIYDRFQRRLMGDLPLIFLFTPKLVYIVSNRVSGIDLSSLVNPEDRFDTISQWKID